MLKDEGKATDDQPSKEVSYENGIINIQRANTEGRYCLWLTSKTILKSDYIEGRRKLKLNCDAKILGGSHRLRFLFKGKTSRKWLAKQERVVADDTWSKIEEYFLVSSAEDCEFRIDDFALQAPSSVQIRNLVLTEKTQ